MTVEVAAPQPSVQPVQNATLKRRLICLVYELLILAAVLFAATLPVILVTRGLSHTLARPILQVWLLVICGWFYARQWVGEGQTLPMKTWKIKVVDLHGAALTTKLAWLRYAAALASIALLGLGFVWALIDRDRQFLHDRLAGTRLIHASQ